MSLKPEVLSPVGSPQSLEAAVRCGADAVYIGAKKFSARRNAENFDINDIRETVCYCHIRGVKVYLALNIMIKQSELQDAFKLAAHAYECGVDAIIISDLGLASLIHECIPDMPLHASTQMTVHSKSALPLLKNMGFTRVVVSREMSKKELEIFCTEADNLSIEVEMFVHGALCMSVSGQCLLSSVLGARSGNRGLCAGPCRLPFAANGGTGYDLSLKDLCLYDYVNEISNIGVSSLKIEGRMKRPEYIAAATTACRQAVDNGYVKPELLNTLKNVFSRSGFTDGYYKSNLGREMFGIRTKEDVIASNETFSYLHTLYRAERQSVPIDVNIDILSGKPITLKIYDGFNSVCVMGEIPQRAENKPLEKSAVSDSISKFGNTPYYCNSISINIDDGLFVPVSALNSLRRSAIEKLNAQRSKISVKKYKTPEILSGGNFKGNKKFIARFSTPQQIPDTTDNISAIMLPYECEFPKVSDRIHFIAELPRYIADETQVINRLGYLKSQGIKYAYCGNLSAVAIAEKIGFKTIASFNLNTCNSQSIVSLKNIGVNAAMVSAEISIKEIKNISAYIPIGVFAYGRLPLMLTRNCPVKNGTDCSKCLKNGYITDRKNIKFPVMCRCGYSEVLNSAPLYMGDKLDDIPKVDFLLLYFTDEKKSEASEILDMYINGSKPFGDYTRNLYYRDLI